MPLSWRVFKYFSEHSFSVCAKSEIIELLPVPVIGTVQQFLNWDPLVEKSSVDPLLLRLQLNNRTRRSLVLSIFLLWGYLLLLVFLLWQGTTGKYLSPSSSYLSIRFWYSAIRSSLSLLFSKLSSLRLFSLPFYFRSFRLLITFMTLCWTCSRTSMSLLYWEPRSGPNTPGVLSLVLVRETRISAGTTGQGLLFHKNTLLEHGQLVFHNPNVFFGKTAFQLFWCWCMGLFSSYRALHFPSLSFMKVLSAQFSSLFRSLWMAARPSQLLLPLQTY